MSGTWLTDQAGIPSAKITAETGQGTIIAVGRSVGAHWGPAGAEKELS